MRALVFIGGLLAAPALGAEAPRVLELLGSAEARPLLAQDPALRAAGAAREAARREARLLELSPHEWNARAMTQRRSVRPTGDYPEWNVGVERALRLPAKAEADRGMAAATLALAEARYGEALHEAARRLLGLYVDWLAAEHAVALAEANRTAARESLAAVEKRVQAGDASRLDRGLAEADAAEQDRVANDAHTAANAARERLHARYAGLASQPGALPEPPSARPALPYWRERILAQSDRLMAAQSDARLARAKADRARAERIPDPTLGVFAGSEFGGAEKLVGVYVSIPLGGERRRLDAARGESLAEAAREQARLARRELEAEVAASFAAAAGAYESWRIAEAAARAAQQNAQLVQRAYSLGESDLQSLLLARRQATGAAQGALASRIAALRAYSLLLIDAHLVWGLAHEAPAGGS